MTCPHQAQVLVFACCPAQSSHLDQSSAKDPAVSQVVGPGVCGSALPAAQAVAHHPRGGGSGTARLFLHRPQGQRLSKYKSFPTK